MGRALPLFALLGSIGVGALGLANEPTPRASEAPKSPGSSSSDEPSDATRPEGVTGNVTGGAKTKQEHAAANREKKRRPAADDKAKDKYKASQSGNDATLRQLPSPAQRGSE